MERAYVKYYQLQAGGGINDIGPVLQFHPTIQGGRGIGNIFGSLARYLKPILSTGWDIIKKESLDTGKNIFGDIISGANIKESVIGQSKSGVKNLRKSVVNKLHTLYGGSKEKTIKRKAKPNKSHSKSKRLRKKERVIDIFN